MVRGTESLRSKGFLWRFRQFEAFFAFWRRKNWGERNTFFCARLNFDQCLGIQKAKNHDFKPAESPSETLATRVILNFLDVKKIRYFDSNCVECNKQQKTKLNFDQFVL